MYDRQCYGKLSDRRALSEKTEQLGGVAVNCTEKE